MEEVSVGHKLHDVSLCHLPAVTGQPAHVCPCIRYRETVRKRKGRSGEEDKEVRNNIGVKERGQEGGRKGQRGKKGGEGRREGK